MLSEIQRRVRLGSSFAFETTLSGKGYSRLIPHWQKAGFTVKLIFLHLPNQEIAIARVAARVAQGGHDVPAAVISRRFRAGLANLRNVYLPLVNSWEWYDNSGVIPVLISSGENLK